MVGDVDTRAAAAGDVDGLLHALFQSVALIAQMGGVDTAVAAHAFTEGGKLIRCGEKPRRIRKPRRKAERPGLHPVLHKRLHGGKLLFIRRVGRHAHHGEAHSAVRDEVAHVYTAGGVLHA